MSSDDLLREVLEESRSLGFLGPGPIETHLASAERFRAALAATGALRVLDLGSGGGLPGLPLAMWLPDREFVLLESMQRRSDFLAAAVERLGLAPRVEVLRERAEIAARDARLRAAFEAVVSRSFGSPAVTAECSAPFLRVGGVLLVSEPPQPDPARWPEAGLAELGLVSQEELPGLAVFSQAHLCPERYPRRVGIPTKRPLF